MVDPGFEERGEGGVGARGYYPQKIMIEGEKKNCFCNLVYIKIGGIINTRLFPNIFTPF